MVTLVCSMRVREFLESCTIILTENLNSDLPSFESASTLVSYFRWPGFDRVHKEVINFQPA
jgi:hypothetical protein